MKPSLVDEEDGQKRRVQEGGEKVEEELIRKRSSEVSAQH